MTRICRSSPKVIDSFDCTLEIYGSGGVFFTPMFSDSDAGAGRWVYALGI